MKFCTNQTNLVGYESMYAIYKIMIIYQDITVFMSITGHRLFLKNCQHSFVKNLMF